MSAQLAALAASTIGRFTYVMGGIPAQGRVDCSSLGNEVVGHMAGLAIPGFRAGQYKGQSHGPVVLQWATTGLCTTIHDPAPGDLAIWPGVGALGHMGFVAGGGEFISALDPAQGIQRIPIKDVRKPVPVMYRRVNAAAGLTSAPGAGSGCVPAMILAPFLIAHSLVTGRRYHDG